MKQHSEQQQPSPKIKRNQTAQSLEHDASADLASDVSKVLLGAPANKNDIKSVIELFEED